MHSGCEHVMLVLQPLRWRCVDCVIHHERDVREEKRYMYVARTSNNRVIPMEWYWWVTSNNACEPGEQLTVLAKGDDESDLVGWYVLLLAATVRSFAHMPLGISDRNTSKITYDVTKLFTRNGEQPGCFKSAWLHWRFLSLFIYLNSSVAGLHQMRNERKAKATRHFLARSRV